MPQIRVNKTLLSDTIHFNYTEKPFLRQHIDLAPPLFGQLLKSYFSLPQGDIKREVFNPKQNIEKATLIVGEVEKQNLLLALKDGCVFLYFYLFTEVEGVELLFTFRFAAENTQESRKQ